MAGFYDSFDIAVVGGGHAGIEASLAATGISEVFAISTVLFIRG